MALFKVYRGNETNLPTSMNDGWAYFCTDTGNFYIDWTSESGLIRTQVNANCANNLRYLDGNEYAEIDATTLVQCLTTIWTSVQDLQGEKASKSELATSVSEANAYTDNKVGENAKLISSAQARADSAYALAESKVDSLSDLGITATTTELNYVDGVTSNIQDQLNGKADSYHGTHIPTCSTSNNGQFLRVVNGVATWSVVPNAEEATF